MTVIVGLPLSQEIADPAELGVDPDKVADLVERARREVDEARSPSCQLALAREGRLVMFETIGAQRSRYVLFSTTKALTAGAVWLLMGDGLLDVERPVAEYIPEFATNGKGAVTVEQVLLHSSGFPRAPLGPPEWFDRSSRLEAFAQWRLNWDPGTQVEYHATSAHWVLAELIERLSGPTTGTSSATGSANPSASTGSSSASPSTSRATSGGSNTSATHPTPRSSPRSSAAGDRSLADRLRRGHR